MLSFYFCFEIRFCVIQARLKLCMSLRLALNSWSSGLYLPSPGLHVCPSMSDQCLDFDEACPVDSGVVFSSSGTSAQKVSDLGLGVRMPTEANAENSGLTHGQLLFSLILFFLITVILLKHKQDSLSTK